MDQTQRKFAFYPKPQAAETFDYAFEPDKNPALRGVLGLVFVSAATSFSFIPRFLFTNAKFDTIKSMTELRDKDWRALSLVIPLADNNPLNTKVLDFGPEHLQAQPADLPGRFLSAADYTALYKSGQLTPLQVVDGLIPLITDRSRSDHPTAWNEVRVDDVRAAAQASTQRWAAGKPLGPLDGVPVGIKCDTALKGYVRSQGLKPDVRKWPEVFTPVEKSAWCVSKWIEAGAIPLGTLAMHEIGIDSSGCNPLMGTPRNWYNKLYYPGGSSSGPASALGGGVIPIAVGSDVGGSLRIPAAFNGVYSMKTTFGRIEYKGFSSCVVGPMAGTASDLAIAYRIMAQADPAGQMTSQFAPSSVPDFGQGKKYVGICKPWVAQSIPFVRDTFREAVDFFTTKAGYEVVEIDLPYLRAGQLALSALCLAEAAAAARTRVNNPSKWLDLYNAPNRVLLSIGAEASAEDYIMYGQVREMVMQHLAALWQKHPGMLILTPTTPEVGWKVHPGDQKYGFSDANTTIRNMFYVWLANLTGCPASNCPMGYGEPAQGEGKVPIGIQAIGEWGEEERLLAFTKDAERWLNEGYEGGRLRPKEWVDVLALARKEGATNGKAGEESEAAPGGK